MVLIAVLFRDSFEEGLTDDRVDAWSLNAGVAASGVLQLGSGGADGVVICDFTVSRTNLPLFLSGSSVWLQASGTTTESFLYRKF